MKLYIYAKTTEDIKDFEETLDCIEHDEDEVYISLESTRSFRSLNEIKSICNTEDIILIQTLKSLGMNDADICSQLQWFIDRPISLVITAVSATYEYGVSQPMNKAVLTTLLQSTLANNRNVIAFTKPSAGRNKLEFPDNWDELYEKWTAKKITATEFREKTGLKKATFYNMVTEYRQQQEANIQYRQKYKCI